MAPENAHEIPRPRSAGLAPPRQLVKVVQNASRSGLEIMPLLSVYDAQAPPDAAIPWTEFSPELTPDEPLRVNW